jgi:hypothetical protein
VKTNLIGTFSSITAVSTGTFGSFDTTFYGAFPCSIEASVSLKLTGYPCLVNE